ncbi:MAG: cobalt ECF transporter T component CbiQ [Planctomycetota bacterium]
MVCETYFQGDSVVHRLDPRGRVVVAVVFSVLVAVSERFGVLGGGLAAGLGLAVAARLPVRPLLKRLAALNAFMVMLIVLLPLTTFEEPGLDIFGISVSQPGLLLALAVTLKANAIVLALTALVGTLEITTFGHALKHLRVPDKLIHLFLFTVRYIDLLHHEYRRLRQAMRVRCFRPQMSRHTYRAMGYLVGMLLVKSLDRSERVVAAMKCRGFRGQFYVLTHFAFARRDAAFGVLAAAALAVLGWMEWG